MKAYRFVDFHKAELEDVLVPEPRPGEVLIKVAGSGACHSDLHLLEWPADVHILPPAYTLGHENAGYVEKLGDGVTDLDVGDPVAVYGPWGCGRCAWCRTGRENYCERQKEIGALGGGLGIDGGMAEYMLVSSSRLLVPLGDLDPVEAAPLSDAGLTPYHAIKRSLRLLIPGSTAVAIGVGGLGNMGVQILRALTSARIIAVDLDKQRLALAQDAGADHTVVSGPDAGDEIAEITQGRGAEVVIDFVGVDQTLGLAAQVARPMGHITIVGIGGGSLTFGFFIVPYECSIATTYWGSVTELMEVIALAQAGKIRSHVERFPLDRVEDAYEALKAGTIEGRAVITP